MSLTNQSDLVNTKNNCQKVSLKHVSLNSVDQASNLILSLSVHCLHRTRGQFLEAHKLNDKDIIHGKSTDDQY